MLTYYIVEDKIEYHLTNPCFLYLLLSIYKAPNDNKSKFYTFVTLRVLFIIIKLLLSITIFMMYM